ncbi:hypothetical protein [Idiomarina sp.]|uniref:hypothetical protein n=1 Tax=Idiomarina sp. TaxID=1874361 RepID=UPI002589A306|nr:hypothetical protein [Idiomarina sp.]
MINHDMKRKVNDVIERLFVEGNTPLKQYGIDAGLIDRVEQENPHVAKQYPWQSAASNVA